MKLSSAKFAPRCGARAISKTKPSKTDGLGMLLEVQTAFGVAGARISARCKMRGTRRGSCCKNAARRGGFEEGPQRCFRVANTGTSWFVRLMFQASDAECAQGLQIVCQGSLSLQG